MKFKGEGNTTVWDAQRDRALCQFEKGELETDDFRTCNILVKLGYECEGDFPEDPDKEIDEEFEALKARGQELKIKNWHTMKKENLIEAIVEAEKAVQ